MPSVDDDAKTLLQYMRLNMELHPADVIIAHGCLDTRVAERAAQLMCDGYGKLLVVSGGLGKITKDINTKTEAEIFRDIAVDMGVPEDKILLEKESTNTGNNIVFTAKLLQEKNLMPSSVISVTKPYMERRLYTIFMKQWPGADGIDFMVTSPQLSYEEHFSGAVPKDMFIGLMVGDLQRIKELPKRGFQIEQDIPVDVWAAYERLVSAGYDTYLINF